MGKTAEEEDNDHLFFSRGTKKQRRSLLPFVKGGELFFLTGDFNAGGSRYNNFAGKGRKTERAT